MKITNASIFFLLLIPFFGSSLAQTSVQKIDDQWMLMVDEQPFQIKGVTFGYDKDTANYNKYFAELVSLGVNTIRTWATGDNTPKLLETAEAHGIKVMMGIWMRHGRPGMEDDDSFNYLEDEQGMEAMYQNAISVVQKFKDRPAVLTWTIGNEVYLNMETDEEKEAYSKLLQRICVAIKAIDSTHPIASVEAWTFGLDWWEQYVPSIDVYGINCYGAGANFLQEELDKRNITKPYVITEYGVTGEWDMQEDTNGIKTEPDDQAKFNMIANGYHDWILSKPSCLGVYVFHYSNDDRFIGPWLLTHYQGKLRPQYWAVRKAYTGQDPENYVPEIRNFSLPDGEFPSGEWVPVSMSASDKESEALNVSFAYNQRTGSRKRRDQINTLQQRGTLADGFEIQLPKEHGAIKVYAQVTDSYGNMGIATTSIKVKDEERRQQRYLVPKASLPFYVYKDGEDVPYAPSAYMGNYKEMEVNLRNQDEVYSGTAAIEITYRGRDNWYGLGLVDPANDWGEILGGYDLSEATSFSFWAKSDYQNLTAKIGFGLIDADKPYPDTAKKLSEITLTKKWKRYKVNLKKLDMSCIRSGLVIFSGGYGYPHKIYLDEVVFE